MLTFPIKTKQSDIVKRPRVQLHAGQEPSATRQEFKDEADINKLLNRFGVHSLRPVSYGDYDYDVDLQTALDAIEKAERGYDRLPPELKEKYPNWDAVILALADGAKTTEIRELLEGKQPPKQEKENATRSDAKGSGEGDSGKPATG